MSRLIWGLFCEEQTTGDGGKNSYHNIFDTMTVKMSFPVGDGIPETPLEQPAHTSAFVLALNLTAEPGSPKCRVCIRDYGGRDILPEMESELPDSPDGRHNLHLRFTHGIPVRKSGIYVFEVYIEDQSIGQVEMPVSLELLEE